MNKEEIKNIINDEMKKKNFTNKFVEIANLISDIYQLGFENGFNVACEIEKRKNETLQSQLEIANKKLDKIKELVNKYGYYTLSEIPELLSIIEESNDKNNN